MRYDIINQDSYYDIDQRVEKIFERINEVVDYTYMFRISATNKDGVTKEFNVNFQPTHESYGDFDLRRSTLYCDDGDESTELLDFFAVDDINETYNKEEEDKAWKIIEELQGIAEDEAEKLIKELNSNFDED